MSLDEQTSGILDKSDRSDEIIAATPTITVFNRTLTFSNNPSDWHTQEDDEDLTYQVNIYTTSDVTSSYTLNVYGYAAEESSVSLLGSVSGNYNKEIDLNDEALTKKVAGISPGDMKPSDYSDYVFIGWKECAADGANPSTYLVSTHPNFGFNITRNMNIVAVFGTVAERTAARANSWGAYIDRNENNVERSNDGDKLYNDAIVRFTNQSDSAMMVGASVETGIVILAQKAVGSNVTSTQQSAFTALGKDNLKAYIKALKNEGRTSAKMNSTTYGAAYAYYIPTTVQLTDLNRADICQILNYNDFHSGKYLLASYYKDGENYILSDVIPGTYN